MPTVTFLRTTEDGQQEMGTATFRAGRVVYDGLPQGLKDDLALGIRLGGDVIMPSAGVEFLKAIPVQYRGSYVRAVYKD